MSSMHDAYEKKEDDFDVLEIVRDRASDGFLKKMSEYKNHDVEQQYDTSAAATIQTFTTKTPAGKETRQEDVVMKIVEARARAANQEEIVHDDTPPPSSSTTIKETCSGPKKNDRAIPGAFKAAPGMSRQRVENIRFSLVGQTVGSKHGEGLDTTTTAAATTTIATCPLNQSIQAEVVTSHKDETNVEENNNDDFVACSGTMEQIMECCTNRGLAEAIPLSECSDPENPLVEASAEPIQVDLDALENELAHCKRERKFAIVFLLALVCVMIATVLGLILGLL